MDPIDLALFAGSKDASRGVSSDMSSEGISRRFAILQELNELCAWLGSAKSLGPVEGEVESMDGDEAR